jgi:hypothetical protein
VDVADSGRWGVCQYGNALDSLQLPKDGVDMGSALASEDPILMADVVCLEHQMQYLHIYVSIP